MVTGFVYQVFRTLAGAAGLVLLATAVLHSSVPQDAATAGGSAPPPLSAACETRLRERVASWHEARKVRDQQAMYSLLEPDYRAKVDFPTYARQTTLRLRFSLLEYEIATFEPASDNRVTVVVNLRMDLGRFGEHATPATDTWVWREGDWWLVFKELELPFPK